MEIGLQRKIDRVFGPLICGVLSFFAGSPAPVGTPRRILVILLSEMGSLVLGVSMFSRIREKYPDSEIHALILEKNREILDLLEVIPAENVITLSDFSFKKFASDSLAAIRRMRKLQFDVVIDCELFTRVSSIFSFFTGAPVRVGFHPHTMEGLYRGSFISRPVLYNSYRHISDQFLALVEAIESTTVPRNKSCELGSISKEAPSIRLLEGELEAMREKLLGNFPSIIGKKLVLIYPGGGILPIRAWPLEYFCKTARELVDRGFAVGVIGLPGDKELAKSIVDHCRSELCIDLTGYTKTIRELLVLFHLASLLITNDGGPGQFAAMTPIRTIIFFGPETPLLYGPNSSGAKVFYSGIACSPCLTAYNHRNSPCDGDNKCLKIITPESVLECALSLIDEDSLQC